MSAEQPFNPELADNKVETPELHIEQEKREVARVFVLQSRSDESVKQLCESLSVTGWDATQLAERLAGEFLTHSLWIRKNKDARNPGQTSPVGGGKIPEDHDDISRTAIRELLEEIHVRPVEMNQLQDREGNDLVIHYEMKHRDPQKEQKDIENSVALFVAKILPSDVPHQQNQTEDKIDIFPRLNLSEKGLLWGKNELEKDGGMTLMDSFQFEPKDITEGKNQISFPDIEAHRRVIAETMNALGIEARAFEAEKIIDVAKELVGIAEWKAEKTTDFAHLHELIAQMEHDQQDLPATQKLYSTLLKECAQHINLLEWFPHAVERSNFKEELRNPGKSKIEGAMRFAFLLAKSNLSLSEIAILKKEIEDEDGSSKVSNEYYDLIGFLKKIIRKDSGEDVTDEMMVEYARSLDTAELEDNPDLLNDEFTRRTGIADLANKAARIDKFLVNMFKLGLAKDKESATLDPERGGPLTNVDGANLENLLLYAFEEPPASAIKANFLSEDSQTRLKFESLRKLFLLSALEPASQRYDQVLKLGKKKIEEMWSNLLFIDENTQQVSKGEHVAEHETRYMRGFKQIDGLLVTQDVRTKQVDSYFRKIILRGFDDPENLWDIYGRSVVLAADPNVESTKTDSLFIREEFEVETFQMDEAKNLVPHKQTVQEFPAVIKIIQQLQAQGAKVVDYDPTNTPGTSFNSAGPGGGDPITMAKFYICLETNTSRGTTRRFEEVQVFSPTEDGKTGFDNKETKEFYDQQRAVRRLLDTKGLRSFIELMFPVGIYGDLIHQLYQKNGNGNGHKQK